MTLVFGGPSLIGLDLSGRDMIFLPPAVQGDLLRYERELRPDAIGLLDCELPYRGLPTWHKEILAVMDAGVYVAGASGVGAHRACELAPFGMEGVGTIFERVASGELERDDEVLCDWVGEPSGVRLLSVPLVVIRDVLKEAEAEGILSAESGAGLISMAEGFFWRLRTWESLLKKAASAGVDPGELDLLTDWLPRASNAVKNDSEALLNRLEEPARKGIKARDRRKISSKRRNSAIFKSMDRRDRPVDSEYGPVRQWAVADMVTFSHPDGEDLNRGGLNRKLALMLGEHLWNIDPSIGAVKSEERRLKRRLGIESDEDLSVWMADNDVDDGDFRRLVREEAILHHLHRWLMQGRVSEKNSGIVLDELKLRGDYVRWKRKAARRESLLETDRDVYLEEADRDFAAPFMDRLRDHLRAEGLPWKASLIEMLSETGMEISDFGHEMTLSKVARTCIGRTLGLSPNDGDTVDD
ncbi:hypothetical protein L2W58_04560 [Dethiosulfovibrio sp. F2B]|uniref:TfuA-like protein n=1 Tax=Dethiosulfovibrio faecalis TaxID=2720018 RepID=UPI001EEC1A67|nr:hypothetical protein [Dethiosulfovibrio faecalis]